MLIQAENLFTVKETAEILGLSNPTKATQSMQPAWIKVAKHLNADFPRGMKQLLIYAEAMKEMSDREISIREAMLTGKLDRSVLHKTNGAAKAHQ